MKISPNFLKESQSRARFLKNALCRRKTASTMRKDPKARSSTAPGRRAASRDASAEKTSAERMSGSRPSPRRSPLLAWTGRAIAAMGRKETRLTACAAACGKLLGLGADGICHAIAIAALQAGGLLLIAESGQCCKPLNPANAARTGILSARLAAKGVKGPVYPLESEKGWFHAVTDEVHYEMLEGLGETFTICESYLKPYPSCRHTHCGIEAATHIRERLLKRGKTAGDIRQAVLMTYPNGIGIAGQIRVPETPDEAKFSIHYSAAAALYTGNYTIGDLEQAPRPEVGMLAEKILLVPDPVMEDTARDIRGARLSVELSDGTVEEETVLLPKGEADNPMTWGDMERKLEACLEGTACRAETLIRKLREVDMEARYEGITALL